MRIVWLIGLLSVFFSCRLQHSKIKKNQDCKEHLLQQLEKFSMLVSIHEGSKAYDFDYEKIPVPIGYDTIVWNTEVGKTMGLDSIHTQYMVFGKMLKQLVSNVDSCKLTREDIVQSIGTPSNVTTLAYPEIFYHFNTLNHPDCYADDIKAEVLRFSSCSFLSFRFDKENKLQSVGTMFFQPLYD